MTEAESGEFLHRLNALAELHKRELSPAAQRLYFEALRDLPLEQVIVALNRAVQASKFFPMPVELRALVAGDDDEAAERSWLQLRRAIREFGAYRSIEGPPAFLEAIRAVFGSWPAACSIDLSPEMWSAKRKEWGRVYKVLREEPSSVKGLPDIVEMQNAGRAEWQRFVEIGRVDGATPRRIAAGSEDA